MFIQVFLSAISFQKHLFFENFKHQTHIQCVYYIIRSTHISPAPLRSLAISQWTQNLFTNCIHCTILEFENNNKNEQFWACSFRHATLMPAWNTPISLLCHPISSSFLKRGSETSSLVKSSYNFQDETILVSRCTTIYIVG